MKYAIKILMREHRELTAEVRTNERVLKDMLKENRIELKKYIAKFKRIIKNKKEKVSELKKAIYNLKK